MYYADYLFLLQTFTRTSGARPNDTAVPTEPKVSDYQLIATIEQFHALGNGAHLH